MPYIRDLKDTGRDEIPRWLIVSDFARIALHDLEPEGQPDLPLFTSGAASRTNSRWPSSTTTSSTSPSSPATSSTPQDQDPVNLEAAQIMGDLHDALEAGGYSGHDLERFLVRILFCLFAEDTGIFERESFRLFIENRTAPDGSDLGLQLARLFEVLNTPPEKRQTKPRRNSGRLPLRQRRPVRRAPGLCRFQPRHAQRAARLHAQRLVAHLARHFRLALPGHHGDQGAPADRRRTTPANGTS